MQKCTLLFALAFPTLSYATSDWGDVLRQYPASDIQQLESANSTLAVLRIPTHQTFAKGTIVLLPDQQNVFANALLSEVRQALPRAGWQLIALPPPATQTTFENNELRLQQQRIELQQRWLLLLEHGELKKPIIAIAQGETAGLMNLLLTDPDNPLDTVSALVSLGAYISDSTQHAKLTAALPALPQLDLHNAADHPWASKIQQQRAALAQQQKNVLYRPRNFPEIKQSQANQTWLVNEIKGWLNTNGF